MEANTAPAMPAVAVDDVMASVDDDGTEKNFIIADISCDDSWIMISLEGAATLLDWR